MAIFRDNPYGISAEDLALDLRLLFQLIFNNNENIPLRNYTRLQDILDMNDLSIEKVMDKIAPKCSDLLQRCKWKGRKSGAKASSKRLKLQRGIVALSTTTL